MDISFSEICLIILVAFLVFGPEKLPDVARKVGRMIGRAKSIWKSVTQEIENTLSEVHAPTSEQQKIVKNNEK
jgi:sec-independent protein translocase protein TatB